jgi:aminomethyltransferase
MREMEEQTKKTPLYSWHVAHGANMGTFAGWSMPLWFSAGAVAEHQINLTATGIFDTSHMSALTIIGPGAFEFLQLAFTKDLRYCVGSDKAPLMPGKCVCGAFLNEQGEVVDDTIVYQIGIDNYMAVINAGMAVKVRDHLQAHLPSTGIRIGDLTGKIGKIDLQGPASAKVLMKVLKNPDMTLRDMLYFSFKGHFDTEFQESDTCLEDGTAILLSRTGYTGEFGFEIFVRSKELVRVWEIILQAGQEIGLLPCGLAARDSLRAGACLPLSQHDIGPWPFINNPWPFALPYNEESTAFTKSFIGDGILKIQETAPHTHAFVGYDPRKVSTTDPAVVLDSDGNEIGVVLTCVADMAIARYDGRVYSMASPDRPEDFKPKGLCCGFVKVKSKLASGQEVELKDNRRRIKVTIVDDIRPDRTARRHIRDMMY